MDNSVVKQVFEDFLKNLATQKEVDEKLIARLRSVLAENNLSMEGLQNALFAEDALK